MIPATKSIACIRETSKRGLAKGKAEGRERAVREYEREDSLLSAVGGTIILADRGGIAW